jgi:hypothetical protein
MRKLTPILAVLVLLALSSCRLSSDVLFDYAGEEGLPLTPDFILALHADLYTYVPGEGGNWKQQDNIIRQILPDGRDVVRCVPLSADEAPDAMKDSSACLFEIRKAPLISRRFLSPSPRMASVDRSR